MPTSPSSALLNFFVVLKPQSGGTLAIRRLQVDNEVQQELSEKFATMSEWWFGRDIQKKPYAATYEPTAGQVTSLRSFTIPDIYLRAAGSAQDIEPFTFPVPDNWHLRAIVGIDRRNPAKESRFLFQACDQRQVLGYKFVIFRLFGIDCWKWLAVARTQNRNRLLGEHFDATGVSGARTERHP